MISYNERTIDQMHAVALGCKSYQGNNVFITEDDFFLNIEQFSYWVEEASKTVTGTKEHDGLYHSCLEALMIEHGCEVSPAAFQAVWERWEEDVTELRQCVAPYIDDWRNELIAEREEQRKDEAADERFETIRGRSFGYR